MVLVVKRQVLSCLRWTAETDGGRLNTADAAWDVEGGDSVPAVQDGRRSPAPGGVVLFDPLQEELEFRLVVAWKSGW